jgi:hypothetical protein
VGTPTCTWCSARYQWVTLPVLGVGLGNSRYPPPVLGLGLGNSGYPLPVFGVGAGSFNQLRTALNRAGLWALVHGYHKKV